MAVLRIVTLFFLIGALFALVVLLAMMVAINRGRELAKYVDLKSGQYRAQAEFTRDLDAADAS